MRAVQTQSETFALRIMAAFEHPDTHLHLSPGAVAHYMHPGEEENAEDGLRFNSDKYETLLHDVADRGIHTPVQIYTDGVHGYLGDGRHRVDAAQRLGLDSMPVQISSVAHNPDWFDPHHADMHGNPIYREPKKVEPELASWLNSPPGQQHMQNEADRIEKIQNLGKGPYEGPRSGT